MKEAAGEANMTVITIILIGVIAAIAIPVVNTAMKSAQVKSCCNNAGGVMKGSSCDTSTSTNAEAEYNECMGATGQGGK